jgi:hypothetical protein
MYPTQLFGTQVQAESTDSINSATANLVPSLIVTSSMQTQTHEPKIDCITIPFSAPPGRKGNAVQPGGGRQAAKKGALHSGLYVYTKNQYAPFSRPLIGVSPHCRLGASLPGKPPMLLRPQRPTWRDVAEALSRSPLARGPCRICFSTPLYHS